MLRPTLFTKLRKISMRKLLKFHSQSRLVSVDRNETNYGPKYSIYIGKDAVWDATDILLIPTLLWDQIVSGVDWNIVNHCLGKLGKGGYNILSEKCEKPFKELVKPP